MTIITFTRQTVNQLQDEIKAAIAPIAKTHGVKIEMGRGKFNPNSFTMKIEGAVIAADGIAVTREAEAFRKLAHTLNFAPSDLGRSFPFRGGTAKIVGLNPRAPRLPILVVDENGKTWRTGAENVRFQLNRSAP